MTPLPRDTVTHHLARLRSSLTRLQAARLDAVADVLGDDGRFLFAAALDAAELSRDARGQDAFREFRDKVNVGARFARVDVALELDSRKVAPDQRYGWFTGGDLVDEGIAAFTGRAAAATGIEHPVAPEVAELGASRRLRVYVSFHPTTGDTARRVDALRERLGHELDAGEQRWEIDDPRSVEVGSDAEATRDRLSARADVRLVLLSPAYLAASGTERGRALDSPGRVVAFALSTLPDGPVDLGRLHRDDVGRVKEPWDELTRPAQRAHYVGDVARALRRALRPGPNESPRSDEPLTAWIATMARARRDGDSAHLVPSELAETSLRESRLDASAPATGPALPAVDRLVEWAIDTRPGAPRLCALLGDVGMGKTTTAKLFTQELLDLRTRGRAVPLPILFDLRDVRVTGLTAAMTLDTILDTMLDATRPADVLPERLCAAIVRRRLAKGDAVVVFDGLDEVLVHLSLHDRQLFTRQLWRALESPKRTKMLLTCRTQYFRTIRDEATYFTGEGRQGLRGDDYLALLMLPFRDEQVREYLAVNLDRDDAWVDGFLATISAVHNLPELAQRPMTLRLIADQVEFIETAKLEGHTLRAVDLYAEVVEHWLARDSGKHTLIPEHKHLLMEEIAAGLWRSGVRSWGAKEVDDWLLALLDRRPDIRRHYREHVPDLWKADFRTATFLKRDGDSFEFGHRSLFEYFLARYLLRALAEAESHLELLAMPVPSPETLDFLGQSIAGAAEDERASALAGLAAIGRRYVAQVSELAFAYALDAHEFGHPHQSLVGVALTRAQLQNWPIATVGDDDLLSMSGADLSGADLRRATFDRVDLSGADLTAADLTNAELYGCRLVDARVDDARAAGTILSDCALDGTEITRARTYRTQVLRCSPAPEPAGDLLVAPSARGGERRARLQALIGSVEPTRAVAWSPDAGRLACAGDDGVAQVWDATTGELLYRLTGHTGPVAAMTWSADGTNLVTGGHDGTARIWNTTTGDEAHRLDGHAGRVLAVCWSPDGSQLVTGGGDHTVRIWDACTGTPIRSLVGHAGWVEAVSWSPDGTRLATGGNDSTARIWDPTTGDEVRRLTGHAGGVLAVCWSPDGTRLATASIDNTARIWDPTGHSPRRLTGHSGWVQAVAWSPDGTRIATGSKDGTARTWDATTGAQLRQLSGHSAWVEAVAWSPDGTRIATGSKDGTARTWDATTGAQLRQLSGHGAWVEAVAWSPDGTHLATSHDGSTTWIWDTTSGAVLHQLADHADDRHTVAWSPDSSRLAIGGVDGVARIWDTGTGTLIHELTRHVGWVEAMAWSPDSSRLAIGEIDGVARIWDTTTGTLIHQLTGHTGWVEAVAWSPDGTRLATGSTDRTARMWDSATGESLGELTGHTSSVEAVAWSPDGLHAATTSIDGITRIWNSGTGSCIDQLVDDDTGPETVAWRRDGIDLVGGSPERAIRVRNGVADDPTGFVITALPDGGIAVFDAITDELVGASDDAWRWLGYVVVRDGQLTRLPAETFGPLPALRGTAPDDHS